MGDRMRVRARLWSLVSAFAVLLPVAFAAVAYSEEETSPSSPVADSELRQLTEQLGDVSFAVRETAADRILRIGIPALEILREAQFHADPEIRFRAKSLLALIEIQDRDRRLKAFLRGEETKDVGLVGWERFSKEVGSDQAAKQLFADILRAEWELIKAAESDPEAAGGLVARYCEQLKSVMRYARQQLSLGTVSGLIFVASADAVRVDDNTEALLYSYCYQSSFRQAIEGGKQRDHLRRLLGNWIACNDGGTSSYQSLMMAMRYDLKEGLKAARKTLEAAGVRPHYRQYAMLAMAKLGKKDDVRYVTKYFNDETVCSSRTVRQKNKSKVVYQTKLCDIALAAAIHLSGKDPKDFGFEKIQPNTQMLFNPSTLGFSSDEDRKKAFAKWQQVSDERSDDPNPNSANGETQ